MTDANHVLVTGWESLEPVQHPDLTDRDKQRVATIFTEQSWEYVIWIPTWLLEDKAPIETVESSEHLAVGDIDDYSEKAWQFGQPHRNQPRTQFLPKSETIVFERGAESIETPQQGLAAFGGDSDGA